MKRQRDLSCRGFVALVDDYLDVRLSSAGRAVAAAHLDACPDCSSYLSNARRLLAELAGTSRSEAPVSRLQLERLREALGKLGS